MTENEAIKELENEVERLNMIPINVNHLGELERNIEVLNTAISCLREIQQYRTLGTVEEIESWNFSSNQLRLVKFIEKYKEKLKMYEVIGTVEECREARERQMAKKPIKQKCEPTDEEVQELVDLGFAVGDVLRCPYCNDFIVIKDLKHCMECGQRLDWK